MNQGSEVLSSAHWGSGRNGQGDQVRQSAGNTPKGVQLSLDWTRRLKHVCTQACDKAKGRGRCQMRVGPRLTSDLSSKNEGQPKTRVCWCSSYVPFPHEKTRLMN